MMQTVKLNNDEMQRAADESNAIEESGSPIDCYAYDYIVDCSDAYGDNSFKHLCQSCQTLDDVKVAVTKGNGIYAASSSAVKLLNLNSIEYTRRG